MPETEQNEFVVTESPNAPTEILNPLGDIQFPSKNKTEEIPPMASYPVQRSNKASIIPKIYGTVRVAGNIIWMGPNHPWQQSESSGGKGGGGGETVTNSGNRRSFLIGICEGPALVLRVWKGKEEITFNQITVFRGDGSVDTGIEDLIGEDFTNYPNTCCVYFDEFELGSSEQVPNFTFEVTDQFDPNKIQIYNATDLQNINNDLDGDYELMNDIDCSSIDNWNPIGEAGGSAFTGSFDGRNFIVSNVTIARTTNSIRIGFFGTVTNAEIKNCIITNINITSTVRLSSCGLFIGTITSATPILNITNCFVSGTITQTSSIFSLGDAVGGFVGFADLDNGSLLRCGCEVIITSAIKGLRVGGFVGIASANPEGIIQDCYATGSILMPAGVPLYGVGGFVGQSDSDNVNPKQLNIFTNCYAAVKITGKKDNSFFTISSSVGAFSGRLSLSTGDFKEFNDCFWDNDVDSDVTGIVGDLDDCGNRTGGVPAVSGNLDVVTKSNTSAMFQEATFTNWDFDEVWQIEEGQSYPTLRWAENALPSDENPAIIIKDLLTNTRYGGNIDEVTYIDSNSFTEVEEYCDTNGLRFSFAIDSQKPVLDWVKYILDHFFGYLFMSQGKIHLGIYKEES